MSQQVRPKPTLLTVCDLCDEPISEQQSAKVSSLAHGYGGYPEKAKATAWYLLWKPRGWPGGPSWNETQRDPERWRERHYDFHTECLLRTVEQAIEARRPAPSTTTEGTSDE